MERFETLIPSGQRSQVIETLLQRELDAVQKQRLRDLVEEGLAELSRLNKEAALEWQSADSEGWPKP